MRTVRAILSCVISAVAGTLVATAAGAPEPNSAPTAVASAGQDLQTGEVFNQVTLYIGPADPGIQFTVTGSGSTDPDGDQLSFRWGCRDDNGNSCLSVGSTNPADFRSLFREGRWDVTLTVNDGHGHSATDTVTVKVLVDRTPPDVTPPDDISVSATQTGGARGADSGELHTFLFDSATATDNSTAIFTSMPPQVNGVDVGDDTVFPLGKSTVTFRIADRFGNVGTATADVFVVDLQPGDLFVGNGVDTGFGGHAGVIYRIRNGQMTVFCESPRNSLDPGYWPAPEYIAVDSKGRVAAMAHLLFPNSYKFLRCNQAGQPAEKLGTFFGNFADPAWPQPFPHRNLDRIKGLHIERRKVLASDDAVNGGELTWINEESYVFAGGLDGTTNPSDRHSYRLTTDSLKWIEDDLDLAAQSAGGQLVPEMYFHSKWESVTLPFVGINVPAPVASTYLVAGAMLRRVFRPLELQVVGSVQGIDFEFRGQLFAGSKELFADIANDIHSPMEPTGCTGGGARTVWNSPSRSRLSQFANVAFHRDFGLVLKSEHGGLPAWMGQTSEAMLNHDVTDDRGNMVLDPSIGCGMRPIVDFVSLTPGYHADPHTGEGMDPRRVAVGEDALFGTQPETRRVIRLQPGSGVSTVVDNLLFIAGAGIGAYPPRLGSVEHTTVIIRVDSPVEVVVSDAHGRRLGAVAGQAINEFGEWGFDSGAQSHPRFYVINHPQPGNYSVRSVGTGSGPFTVHVYSVDTSQRTSQHLSSRGVAAPGALRRHDFTLSAAGEVAFTNAAPIANAGADQTLTAGANGTALVAVDGSSSTDPDSDPITFTWAGPDAFARSATAQLTFPVGEHVLTLSVDDGRGGTAEDTIQITVVRGTEPVDTTAPIVTPLVTPAPNAAGWHASPATVTWSVADPESGVPTSSGCAATSVSQDTTGVTFTCTATNGADLSSSASVTVKLDTQPPSIALVQPADGLVLSLNQSAAANYSCTDATSGLTGCAGPVPSGAALNTAVTGEHVFTVLASDAAGNTTERTHRYRVVQRYAFDGFFAPLVNGPLVNRGPAGRTFPVKFRLANANGVSVGDAAAIAAIVVMPGSCGALAADVTGEDATVDVSGLKYDTSTGVWQFNWKTTKSQTGCWALEVRLADGTAHRLGFELR